MSGLKKTAQSPISSTSGGAGGALGSATPSEISPELVPVVTLLSAQSHRRYIESNFMLLHDLNNEGQPASRTWTEVYGVLSGFQIAMWDAASLSRSRGKKDGLKSAAKRLEYLNLADATIQANTSLSSASGKPLPHVIIISTTSKNRYVLRFATAELLTSWHSALRLALFEYTALQEAYTGALLSAKGAKMSDIRVILAESKYNYGHWVTLKFGAGGAYSKYFVVIENGQKKKKKGGKIFVYEHDKIKRSPVVAEIVSARAAYAVYPNASQMIDSSTLIKIEAQVVFSPGKGKDSGGSATGANVFVMPEAHMSVPGYDTLIRFLVPALDAMRLYGRPEKLNADKRDPGSLLFGLPVLPFVHYLELDDVKSIGGPSSFTWSVSDWCQQLKEILRVKLQNGYLGCGSAHGFDGALNSPALVATPQLDSPSRANFTPTPTKETFSDSKDSLASATLENPQKNMYSLPESNSSLPKAMPMSLDTKNKQLPLPSDRRTGPKSPGVNGMGHGPGPGPGPSLASPGGYASPSVKKALPLPSDARGGGPSPAQSNYPPIGLTANGLPSQKGKPPSGYPAAVYSPRNQNFSPKNGNYSPNYSPNNLDMHKPVANVPMSVSPMKANSGYADSLPYRPDRQKRMSEITQIYTDYASIPSPKDNDLSMALEKLNIKKEVDDAEFDIDSILSQTKKEDKSRKKRDIDIFNPAYSEALLSPAVENNLNPFDNPNVSSPSISAPPSARPRSNLQPTLPQISVDDDEEPVGYISPKKGLRVNTNGTPQGPRAFPSARSPNTRAPYSAGGAYNGGGSAYNGGY